MINLNKKRCFIVLAVFMAVCIVGIFAYVNLANDDIEKSEKEIENLKQQMTIYCSTEEDKNQQKCKDLENKFKAKSIDLCIKLSTDLETCFHTGKIVKEIKNLENEINTKCDNESIGQIDNLVCQELKDDFYLKIKGICENNKVNVKMCKDLIDFVGEKRNKILQNMSYFRQLACKYGDLDGCYKLAIAFGNTTDVEMAKQILQENCAKSHQKSCDKLKEIK